MTPLTAPIAGAVFAAWGRNAPYYLGAALMLVVVALAFSVLRGEAAVPKLEGVPRPEGGS